MRLAIISDSHDNIPNLKKAIDWINKEKIETIIHCGDVCSSDTLKEITGLFTGKIYLVHGNADNYDIKDFPKLRFQKEFGETKIEGNKIVFCHFPDPAETLAGKQRYDLVFYGHSHKPWMKKIGETKLVNPGNLAGVYYKPTFAVYDTKTEKLELKILESLK